MKELQAWHQIDGVAVALTRSQFAEMCTQLQQMTEKHTAHAFALEQIDPSLYDLPEGLELMARELLRICQTICEVCR